MDHWSLFYSLLCPLCLHSLLTHQIWQNSETGTLILSLLSCWFISVCVLTGSGAEYKYIHSKSRSEFLYDCADYQINTFFIVYYFVFIAHLFLCSNHKHRRKQAKLCKTSHNCHEPAHLPLICLHYHLLMKRTNSGFLNNFLWILWTHFFNIFCLCHSFWD